MIGYVHYTASWVTKHMIEESECLCVLLLPSLALVTTDPAGRPQSEGPHRIVQ